MEVLASSVLNKQQALRCKACQMTACQVLAATDLASVLGHMGRSQAACWLDPLRKVHLAWAAQCFEHRRQWCEGLTARRVACA